MLANTNGLSWRLQDAKAQFSAVVEGALRGVLHITRRGKQAVVVLSEQDFAVLQNAPFGRSLSFAPHLSAMPTKPIGDAPSVNRDCPLGGLSGLRDA